MHHHARLREGKRQKRADCIQRYQAVGDATEDKQQRAREQGESINPLGEDQSPSADDESVRQLPVLCDRAGQTRKIRKGRVGGKRQDHKD